MMMSNTQDSEYQINYKTASKKQLKNEMKRLAAVVSDMPFGTTKEFFHLPEILGDGEIPLAIASGFMSDNTWLMTLTNQRIIFLDKGMFFGVKQVDVNLPDIVSVAGKTGLIFGQITVSTTGQNYTIERISKNSVIPFTNLINKTRNIFPSKKGTFVNETIPTKTNSLDEMMDRIERLAEMKEEGILTEEEFQTQKQRLLNN
ncbi:PH domain-containing protein [Citrobacter portucalensis]|uniref:PH domain-containing protein n=1 Tax=Citrobacter portucalensis TaxID=1639133 RepID=UPI00226B42D4|nr:PH domain-containing protein [Citrobacter portucalensis]MCX9062473.1 PH domain-containing protein [Citrobacter portucalensis]